MKKYLILLAIITLLCYWGGEEEQAAVSPAQEGRVTVGAVQVPMRRDRDTIVSLISR